MPETTVNVKGVSIKMTIDTGASTNILDEGAFAKITQSEQTEVQQSSAQLFAYGSRSQLSTLGKFDATLKTGDNSISANLHVVKGLHGSLLSYHTASELGLVEVKVNNVTGCDQLVQQYPNVFKGIGKLKGYEAILHIDQAVQLQSVAQPARKIPFHMRKKVSAELKKLEQQNIIERVEGPTPWISLLVVIPKKNGEIRLCVDMRMPNKAIRRECHPSPTIDDLIHVLNGATHFSKLDLRSGYHQISLAPEADTSQLSLHTRVYGGTQGSILVQIRRVSYFNIIVSEQPRDIPGTLNISDNVIVFGKTKQNHDDALRAVLE